MHNVGTGFPGLCPGKLGLSNTSFPEKTLSLSKPPHVKKQLRCFLTVLDERPFPGKGKERNPSGFLPSLFRTVPSGSSIRPVYRP